MNIAQHGLIFLLNFIKITWKASTKYIILAHYFIQMHLQTLHQNNASMFSQNLLKVSTTHPQYVFLLFTIFSIFSTS